MRLDLTHKAAYNCNTPKHTHTPTFYLDTLSGSGWCVGISRRPDIIVPQTPDERGLTIATPKPHRPSPTYLDTLSGSAWCEGVSMRSEVFHMEWVLRRPGLGMAWDRQSDVTLSMLRLCGGLWRLLGEPRSPVPAPLLSRPHAEERLWRLLSEQQQM